MEWAAIWCICSYRALFVGTAKCPTCAAYRAAASESSTGSVSGCCAAVVSGVVGFKRDIVTHVEMWYICGALLRESQEYLSSCFHSHTLHPPGASCSFKSIT